MIQNLRDYDFEPIFTVPTLIRNEREGAPYARTWVKGYPVLCRYHKGPLGVKGRYGAHTGDANRGGRLGPRSNNEE